MCKLILIAHIYEKKIGRSIKKPLLYTDLTERLANVVVIVDISKKISLNYPVRQQSIYKIFKCSNVETVFCLIRNGV